LNAVFLDTVGVLALLDVRDQWHAAAEAAWAKVLADETDFLTTSLVLVECANAAARRPYRAAVVELRESLTAAGSVIDPSGAEWEQAWRNYASGDAGSAGVVDHLSFLVMRRYGVARAFTNDRHFLAAGIEVLF
jgi:predicted nucleic acid-binding protein